MFSLILALNAALDAEQVQCVELAFSIVTTLLAESWTINDVATEKLAESVLIAGWIRLKLGFTLGCVRDAEAVAYQVLDEFAVAVPDDQTVGRSFGSTVTRTLGLH